MTSSLPEALRQLSPPTGRRDDIFGPLYDKLDQFQKDAVQFCLDQSEAALFFEQGTGKTWITGGVIENLTTMTTSGSVSTTTFPSKVKWGFKALLVVPLTNLESTWAKFLAQELPHITVHRSLTSFKSSFDACKVLLIHYEGLRPIIEKLVKIKFDLVVYDESQRLKKRTSIQSRHAGRLKHNPRKMILSGTPIERNPQDLWAQFRFLAPQVFGTRFKDFANEYMEEIKLPHNYEQLPEKHQWAIMGKLTQKRKFLDHKIVKFIDKIKPHAIRTTKDVLDLPPLNIIMQPLKMRGQQRLIYDDLRKHMITQLSTGKVKAPLKVTQIGRMHQTCGGYLKDDNGNVHEVGRTKLGRALFLVRTQPGPIVIFCQYLEEVAALYDILHPPGGGTVCTLKGRTKRRDRLTIQQDFQMGLIDILICQIRTGGVGIDLFRSHTAIIYSLTYSYIDYEQAISRLHRRGQTEPVNIFLLYIENSIDEKKFTSIIKKRRISDRILMELEMAEEKVFKYGVKDLAEMLGVKETTARVQLRKHQIPKAGPRYGWDTTGEVKEVAEQIRSSAREAEGKDKGKKEVEPASKKATIRKKAA